MAMCILLCLTTEAKSVGYVPDKTSVSSPVDNPCRRHVNIGIYSLLLTAAPFTLLWHVE